MVSGRQKEIRVQSRLTPQKSQLEGFPEQVIVLIAYVCSVIDVVGVFK